ncbi:MAG: hypothetical protein OEZ57_04805, partial [Nitrospirota bacterium]|nr:hypothetical protein [Nitrospirota bacterium]
LAIKAFKRQGSGAIDCLITVAMAYEGLDVPAITHLICLTHIRTKPWIEQVVHRATRMDPLAGPYADQRAYIYAPDDRPFRECLDYILAQRNTAIAGASPSSQALEDQGFPNGQGLLPLTDRAESSIQPLHSGVLGMSNQALWANLAVPAQSELHQETPKERLDRLRQQIEKHVRTHEQARKLAHGTVNRAVYSQFRKSRAAMTETELQKVMKWVSKSYPL